jgi:hypothetical protein
MKDEPELNAGVRNGQVDAVAVCEGDGLGEVGMFVAVEDAPDLIVGAPPAFACVASLDPLCPNGFLDELHGRAPKVIDLDPYSVAVPAAPVSEVRVLGTKALYEHEQLGQNCGLGGPPPRWPACASPTQLRSPDVMSSAEASNSWRDRIGVAP